MSIIKFVERLRLLDEMIRRERTGNARNFASAVGISVSVLKDNLNEMRALGAPIRFCRLRKTYHYTKACKLLFEFEER